MARFRIRGKELVGNSNHTLFFLDSTNFVSTIFSFSIFQEHVNDIDFDYMEYARQRFQQYWKTKPKLLGSVGSSPDVATDGNCTV